MTAWHFLAPASINLALIGVVLMVSRRGLAVGVLTGVTILVALQLVFWFWPGADGSSRNSVSARFGSYLATLAVTFLPGAGLAVVAGQLKGKARVTFATAAVVVSLVLGGFYIITALWFACNVLGDCL